MRTTKTGKRISEILLEGQTEEGFERSRERCTRCQYRGFGESLCDYIGMTGKSRILVSPGVGNDCTAFEPLNGEKVRKQASMTVRMNAGERPADQETMQRQRIYRQMRLLYDEGMNDREIADELGKSPCSIRNWRLREGLRSNTDRKRTTGAAVQERRRQMMELWKQGLNDRQIADRLYLSTKTVRLWRREQGLRSNYERGK